MYYRRRMTYAHCQDGIIIVQPPDQEKHVQLAGTARRIWELLEYPATPEEIAKLLAAEFSADSEEIAKDTSLFLESLSKKGLLETSLPTPSDEELQRHRYLALLKCSLVNLMYPEHELRIRLLRKHASDTDNLAEQRYLRDIRYREPESYQALIDAKLGGAASSRMPYYFSHTMIGTTALDNLERCAETVFSEDIPGDFLEAGVCQGGASIFMRALQICHGQENRKTWVADSFQGIPEPQSQPDIESGLNFSEPVAPFVSFSLEGVKDHFLRYGCLDHGVEFLPGWFSETLPEAPIRQLAILRLDADLYSSTQEALNHLYPLVAKGGFIIIDDYGILKVCRQAVDEYRSDHGIEDPIYFINNSVVYWRKQT